MLSNDDEYKKNVINKIIQVYNNDLLDKKHIKFLLDLKKSNFSPKVVYDIGSSTCHYSRHVINIWPDCDVILFDAFEPLKYLYEVLDYKYNIVLLSDEDDKEVKFYQNDLLPAGNSYYREIGTNNVFLENNYILKKTKKLDTIVKEKNYLYPDLIKIDVQGAELDVIKGALDVFKHTKLLIIEMQHKEYNLNAPNVNITIKYLNELGWKCIANKFICNEYDADYCFMNTNLI
jgi:FkbM family methyltransferase